MILEQGTYRLADDVLAVDIAGENVLMDYGSGKYFGLRGAARLLVEPLREGMNLHQMVQFVSDRCNVSANIAEEDLRGVLPKLLSAGLIHCNE